MASMDSAIQGALPPPPGVTPNFENPESIRPAIDGVNIFLLVLISLATSVRLYTKFVIVKEQSWADYTMIFAYLSFATYFGLFQKAGNYGAGTHQWDVPITYMSGFAYWGWVSEVFYSVCIASARLTLCLQFISVFVVGRNRRFWIITGFICVNMAYYTAQLFFSIFQCIPVAKAWNPRLDGFCLSDQYQHFIVATGSFNLVGDTLMFFFPLYCIWGLHASNSRRMAVAGLFMVGLLGVIASILRLVFSISNDGSKDLTYTLTQVAECTFGEVSAGILVSNLVVLPRFLNAVGVKVRFWISTYWSKDSGASDIYSKDAVPVTKASSETSSKPHFAESATSIPMDDQDRQTSSGSVV